MINGITYKPTKELVADYFTKLLQGSLFRKHRNNIMEISEMDEAIHAEVYQNIYGWESNHGIQPIHYSLILYFILYVNQQS